MYEFPFLKLLRLFCIGIAPFLLLAGILAMFNFNTITFNGEQKHGAMGLLYSLLMIPLFGIIYTIINWLLLNFGNWINKKVFVNNKPQLDKEYSESVKIDE